MASASAKKSRPMQNDIKNLLIISSKVPSLSVLMSAIKSDVIIVQYQYEESTLDSIRNKIDQVLIDKKVALIGILLHGQPGFCYLTNRDNKIIDVRNTKPQQTDVYKFFGDLVKSYIAPSSKTRQLNLLASPLTGARGNIHAIIRALETFTEVDVYVSKDLIGNEVYTACEICSAPVGERFFNTNMIRGWRNSSQSLADYDKCKVVGKGAYGTATLCRKKSDGTRVVLKEIAVVELNAAERLLALNEVNILSILNHPNIVHYRNSFEEEGILIIEMEFANGGTLQQYLMQATELLDEKEILGIFSQIVSAVRYIHSLNILHRDLKSANIFLMNDNTVKVGDFGISKALSDTAKHAATVLGTPYYISPEMCESKPYDVKSDIWALGCILYEMASLEKAFEGSNLPALVNKIMKGIFAPVNKRYSSGFRALISDMLQKEPRARPSANEIFYGRLPELMRNLDMFEGEDDQFTSSLSDSTAKKKKRSVIYRCETDTMTIRHCDLPTRRHFIQLAVGASHVVAISSDRTVYSWGDGSMGQLGHGNLMEYRRPTLVDSLKGKSISSACCGNRFSIFLSDNGIIMSCGSGDSGCLGHGSWSPHTKPRLIESLLSQDIVNIACGNDHVIGLTADAVIYAWGSGIYGQLGLGDEEDRCVPTVVRFERVFIKSIHCGRDASMFLTTSGKLYACGNNANNKLGLNKRQNLFKQVKHTFKKSAFLDRALEPTPVKVVAKYHVLQVHLGYYHTAAVIESGKVYTFGDNNYGQLGTGDNKSRDCQPSLVKSIRNLRALDITCGKTYTSAILDNNAIVFWGSRRSPCNTSSMAANSSSTSTKTDFSFRLSVSTTKSVKSNENLRDQQASDNEYYTHTNDPDQIERKGWRRYSLRLKKHRHISSKISRYRPEYTPVEVLCGHTGEGEGKKLAVSLEKVVADKDDMYIMTETVAPAPRKHQKKRSSSKPVDRPSTNNAVNNSFDKTSASPPDVINSNVSDIAIKYDADSGGASSLRNTLGLTDTTGKIPLWLQEELRATEQNINKTATDHEKNMGAMSKQSYDTDKISNKQQEIIFSPVEEENVVQDKLRQSDETVNQVQLDDRVQTDDNRNDNEKTPMELIQEKNDSIKLESSSTDLDILDVNIHQSDEIAPQEQLDDGVQNDSIRNGSALTSTERNDDEETNSIKLNNSSTELNSEEITKEIVTSKTEK